MRLPDTNVPQLSALLSTSRKGTQGIQRPRIICYHQTHFDNSTFVSLLPLLTQKTAVTHVILAAIGPNKPAGNITINDDPWDSPKYRLLWSEVRTLQSAGIYVMGMLWWGGQPKALSLPWTAT